MHLVYIVGQVRICLWAVKQIVWQVQNGNKKLVLSVWRSHLNIDDNSVVFFNTLLNKNTVKL